VSKGRIAAWTAAGGLWAGELAEAIASPNLLSPCGDRLLDSATVTVTLLTGAWWLADRLARPGAERLDRQERDLTTLTRFAGAVARKAAVTAGEDTRPLPAVRLEDRRRA
jgi:hypothetical protein